MNYFLDGSALVAYLRDEAGAEIVERLLRISIADCFCIALTQRLNGEVVTCDHHEFDAIVPLNLCPIQFIR